MPIDPPAEPWSILEQARVLLARGEPAEAEALLRECRVEFPAFGPAAAALAHLLGVTGRTADSAAAWRAVVRDYSGVLQAWWLVELARRENGDGDPAEAERVLGRCLQRFPDHSPAAAALADLLAASGRPDEADAVWREALESFASVAEPWWLSSAAAVRRAVGRPHEAEALLQALEDRFPGAPEALARQALAAADQEDWAVALERWDACLSAARGEPRGEHVVARAWALLRLGRVGPALEAWRALTFQAPDFVPARLALAAAARELGRWDELCAAYDQLIARDPQGGPAEWWVERLRGRLQDRRQRIEASDLDDLVARFPDSAQAHMMQVEFCFARSLGVDSIMACLDAGLRQTPDSRWLLSERVRVLLAIGEFEAARALASKLAAAGDDHHGLLSWWRVVVDRDGACALVPLAEAAIGRSWSIESGLAIVDFLLRQYAGWADALAERLSEDLLRRFPGRPAIICARARTLLALRRDAAAVALVDALPDLCVTAEALELRAWAATRAGDLEQAGRIWRRILARTWFAPLHSAPPGLQRLTPRGPVDEAQGVTAFSNIRNEMAHLPAFLRHHRGLGVRRFVVVDHGSADGGADFLGEQPDVILYRTGDDFQASGAGMRWINWLCARHGGADWRLELDADEAFVYPGWETTPLDAFVTWLEAEGAQAVGSFMLDLYPRRLTGADDLAAPLEAYRYYDPPAGWAGVSRPPWLQPQGGARARLFQVPEILQKVSLVKPGACAWLNSHATTPARLSEVSGLLLHYKLFNLARRRSGAEPGVNPYMADRTPDLMRRHIRYGACIGALIDRDLLEAGTSAEITDSLTLADRGLMHAPESYRAWLRGLDRRG